MKKVMNPLEPMILLELKRMPRTAVQADEIEYNGCRRWALENLLDFVREDPNQAPVLIVEEWRRRMEEFSYISEGTQAHFGYVLAVDTAEWINDILWGGAGVV